MLVRYALQYCLFISSVSTIASCPLWHYHDNSSHQCQCGHGLICRNSSAVIEEGYCATSTGYKDHYYIGKCPFRHTVNDTNRIFSEMPDDPELLDDVMCGHYNRRGLLCGECYDGFGPAVYSIDLRCANCSHLSTTFAVFSYLSLELVPITLIFLGMLLFHIDITSGPLLGYIIFCQAIALIAEGTYITTYTLSLVAKRHPIKDACISICHIPIYSCHYYFHSY